MASGDCQRNSHQSVWKCSCLAGGNFCDVCILNHMRAPEEGPPHPVAPIDPPAPVNTCGRCHIQPTNCIAVSREISLCEPCIKQLSDFVPAAVEQLPSAPPGIDRVSTPSDEGRASPHSEGPDPANAVPEEVLKQLEAARGQLSSPILFLFNEKKGDIRKNLTQALENMNSLDQVMNLLLQMETDLKESREEVKKLNEQLREGRGGRVEMGGLEELVQRAVKDVTDQITALTRENDSLRNQNGALELEVRSLNNRLETGMNDLKKEYKGEVRALEERLARAEEDLKKQVEVTLKDELGKAVEALQVHIDDQAVETVKRMTGVMPLVAQVDLDSTWLNRESSEKFMELAMLGIGNWVSFERMRYVSRCCVCVAKVLGPSHLMAVFADCVSKQIRSNRENGLQFVKSFFKFYKLTKGDTKAKEVLAAQLSLLEKGGAFTHAMDIFYHLHQLIQINEICEFLIATSAYFQKENSQIEEWSRGLLDLPVEWGEHRPAAEQCTTAFLRAVRDQQFSDSYLLLSQVLRKRDDPMPVFEVVEQLAEMMKDSNIVAHLQQLVNYLLVFFCAATEHSHVNTTFKLLKHLLKGVEKKEVQSLGAIVQAIYGREEVAKLADALVRVLDILSDRDVAVKLGLAVVRWGLKPEEAKVLFAELLLEEFQAPNLEETSAQVERLLSYEESKVESFALALLNSKLTQKRKLFFATLYSLASTVGHEQTFKWMELTRKMIEDKYDAIVQIYHIYHEFLGKTQDTEVAELGEYVLTVLQEPESHDPLKKLLGTFEKALTAEVDYTLLLQIMKLWKSYHKKLPPADTRTYDVMSDLAERVAKPGIHDLVAGFMPFARHGGQASAALALGQLYKSTSDAATASAFIASAFGSLEKTRDQGNNFEKLIYGAERFKGSLWAANLLERVFSVKEGIVDPLLALIGAGDETRVNESLSILNCLLKSQDQEKVRLLAVCIEGIRTNKEVGVLTSNLVQVLEMLEEEQVRLELGFAVLGWTCQQLDQRVEFAQNLLKEFKGDQPILVDTSRKVGTLLTATPQFQEEEQEILALIQQVPLAAACEFSSALLTGLKVPSKRIKLLNAVTQVAASGHLTEAKKWIEFTIPILKTQEGITVQAYDLLSAVMEKDKSTIIAEFGKCLLTEIRTLAGLTSLGNLLDTFAQNLEVLGSDLVRNLMELWMIYHTQRQGGDRLYSLILEFIQTSNAKTPELVATLMQYMNRADEIYASVTVTLLHEYVFARKANLACAYSFFAAALETLNRMREAEQRVNLGNFIMQARGELQEDAFPALEIVLKSKEIMTNPLMVLFTTKNDRFGLTFRTLRHLLKDPPQEVPVLTATIEAIKNNDDMARLAATLNEVLQMLNDKEKAFELGLAVFKWALNQPNQGVNFAQNLLQKSKLDQQTLAETSKKVKYLLNSTPQFQAEQTRILALIDAQVKASDACEFSSALFSELQSSNQRDLILRTLHFVANSGGHEKAKEWMLLTRPIMRTKNDVTVQIYETFNAFISRKVPNDETVEYGKNLLNVLQSQENHDNLKELLRLLTGALIKDLLDYPLLLKITRLWISYRSLVPADLRFSEVIADFIERVASPDVSLLVTNLEATMNREEGTCASATLALVKVYKPAYAASPDQAQRFVTSALGVLKGTPAGGKRNNFEDFIVDTVRMLNGEVQAVKLLESVFTLKKPQIVNQLLDLFEASRAHSEVALLLLNNLRINAQQAELQLLSDFITGIKSSEVLATLAAALMRVLGRLRSQEVKSKLGFAVLKWASKQVNQELAQLLAALEADPQTLEQSSQLVAKVLGGISSAELYYFLGLISYHVPVSTACEFSSALLSGVQGADARALIMWVWNATAYTANNIKAAEWMKLTTPIMNTKYEAMFLIYHLYQAFWNKQIQSTSVVELGIDLLTVLQSQEIHDSLKALLQTLLQILNEDGRDYQLLLTIMAFWVKCKRLLPTNQVSYGLADFLAKSVMHPKVPEMVTSLEEVANTANAAYMTVALGLAGIYMPEFTAHPDSEQHFIDALRALKGMTEGQRNSLDALITAAMQGLPEGALFLVKAVFRGNTQIRETLDATLARLLQVVRFPGTPPLLNSLGKFAESGFSCKLLDTLQPNSGAVEAVSRLLSLADFSVVRGMGVPGVTPELSQALQQRPKEAATLLDCVSAMVQKDPAHFRIADQLLQRLPNTECQLLTFVATLAKELMHAGAAHQYVLSLCGLLLAAFNGQLELLQELKQSKDRLFNGLLQLLNARQAAITLNDIDGLLWPLVAQQGTMLAHIQPTSIRTFNFHSKAWNPPVPLAPEIIVDSSSRWTFLDSDLFCCGGEGYAGIEPSGSTSYNRKYELFSR